MYLTDLLFTLGNGVFVRIKFDGSHEQFCFTTGEKNTRRRVVELLRADRGGAKVYEIIPLWRAQELYIRCS